jgi:RNA polymerase sigma factor (sigma-70 family)
MFIDTAVQSSSSSDATHPTGDGPASRRSPSGRRLPGAGIDVAALVRAAASGDERAWERLVDRYDTLVQATASGLGLKRADVADVAQTTWLRLFQHLGRLHHPERVGGWLATTARHEALRLIRKSRREVTGADGHEFDVAPVDEEAVDTGLLVRERNEALRGAMDTLPARSQLILRHLVIEKSANYADLAARLDMPVGSLGPTRSRCLESLRRTAQLTALAS